MNFKETLNRTFDSLPQTRLRCGGREVPAFRTCGVAGFHVALVVLFAGGLLTGRSLPVLASLATVSGLSFFVYTHIRKWITGREELVLLEHVWFALACNAGALWIMGVPILPYMDLVAVALCPFLAAGRVGCTLVGCCHGQPSSVGITYNEACARDGFARHLVGIRLFPVPALESVGLLIIGALGFLALPLTPPGRVLGWYLIAYSVMRFGLEGIRGDRRPHWLGLSQARWMSLVEFGVALGLDVDVREINARILGVGAGVLVLLLAALAYRWHIDGRRRVLAAPHVSTLRAQVRTELDRVNGALTARPIAHTSAAGVTVALSDARAREHAAHVSLSLADDRIDLGCLCDLAARTFPELLPESAQISQGRILHLLVPVPLVGDATVAAASRVRAETLYGRLIRTAQESEGRRASGIESNEFHAPPAVPEINPDPPSGQKGANGSAPWYFADVHPTRR